MKRITNGDHSHLLSPLPFPILARLGLHLASVWALGIEGVESAMIIMSTADNYEPNTVYQMKFWDGEGVMHILPVYVIRESTKEAWLEFARSTGASEADIKETLAQSKNFYEVSID